MFVLQQIADRKDDFMYKILEKEVLNSVVQKMVIEAPFVARKCEPGQFIILRVAEGGERIPLTIMDYDRVKNTVTIVFQVLGLTTKLLSQKNAGDSIEDFVGPLGKPTKLHDHKRALGIAGGVGAAPLYPQLKKLAEMGVEVDVIIGAAARNWSYWVTISESSAGMFSMQPMTVHWVIRDLSLMCSRSSLKRREV